MAKKKSFSKISQRMNKLLLLLAASAQAQKEKHFLSIPVVEPINVYPTNPTPRYETPTTHSSPTPQAYDYPTLQYETPTTQAYDYPTPRYETPTTHWSPTPQAYDYPTPRYETPTTHWSPSPMYETPTMGTHWSPSPPYENHGRCSYGKPVKNVRNCYYESCPPGTHCEYLNGYYSCCKCQMMHPIPIRVPLPSYVPEEVRG